MKTMNRTIGLYAIPILLMLISSLAFGQNETASYSGTVIDKKTKKSIERCKVYIKNTSIGTISNEDGGFLIKIEPKYRNEKLVFAAVGYASSEIEISTLQEKDNRISLLPVSVVIQEVVVQKPKDMLIEALDKVKENYPDAYEEYTSFYRETIKKNRRYVDVSQGSLQIRKTPYRSGSRDKARILKGYRSKDYEKQDTLVFKLRGGVNSMLYLDVVKHPGMVLSFNMLDNYDYELADFKMINDQLNYVIAFKPKPNLNVPLYTGTISIEGRSSAITEISFGYLGDDLKNAARTLVQKKPSLAKVTPIRVWYDIEYSKANGKWYQYYTRSTFDMKINWKKRLFNSTFYSSSEMVVTERKNGQPEPPIEKTDLIKTRHIFAETAEKISDETFWSSYNIIKPEDDLKKAIAKIEKSKAQ